MHSGKAILEKTQINLNIKFKCGLVNFLKTLTKHLNLELAINDNREAGILINK